MRSVHGAKNAFNSNRGGTTFDRVREPSQAFELSTVTQPFDSVTAFFCGVHNFRFSLSSLDIVHTFHDVTIFLSL